MNSDDLLLIRVSRLKYLSGYTYVCSLLYPTIAATDTMESQVRVKCKLCRTSFQKERKRLAKLLKQVRHDASNNQWIGWTGNLEGDLAKERDRNVASEYKRLAEEGFDICGSIIDCIYACDGHLDMVGHHDEVDGSSDTKNVLVSDTKIGMSCGNYLNLLMCSACGTEDNIPESEKRNTYLASVIGAVPQLWWLAVRGSTTEQTRMEAKKYSRQGHRDSAGRRFVGDLVRILLLHTYIQLRQNTSITHVHTTAANNYCNIRCLFVPVQA